MNPPDWLTDPTYRNVYETVSTQHVADVSYDEWLQHWFGGEIVSQHYPWFRDNPQLIFRPTMAADYAHRLFKNSAVDLEYFHDDQIGGGLYLLISDGDNYIDWPDIPIEKREASLLATVDLFRDLFAARCEPRLSDWIGNFYSPLNCACFMWWENMTHIAYPGDPSFDRMMEGCWRVMEQTLDIPHIAVQQSALHGLGHFTHYDRGRVEATIDRWLAANPDADPNLLQYASAARSGCIQ